MGRVIFTGKHSTFTNANEDPNQPLEDKLNCREDASWGYMGLPGVLAGVIENDWIKRMNNQTDDFIWEHKDRDVTLSRNDAILKQFGFPTNEIVKQLLYSESRRAVDKALKDAGTPKSFLRSCAEASTSSFDIRTPLIRLTDEQLLDRAFFTVLISKYGRDVKEYFKSKEGKVLDHGKVESITIYNTNKTNFVNAIKDKVRKHYLEYGGVSLPFDVSEEISKNMLTFREAFMDKSLMIVFGGVQEISVIGTLNKETKARNFEKHKDVPQLAVDIHVTIRDWYGVDEEDVYKNAFAANIDREGLACLWILQHLRGYPPFINKIELDINNILIYITP